MRFVLAIPFLIPSYAVASDTDALMDVAWECSVQAAARFIRGNSGESASTIAEAAYSKCLAQWNDLAEAETQKAGTNNPKLRRQMEAATERFFTKALAQRVIEFRSNGN